MRDRDETERHFKDGKNDAVNGRTYDPPWYELMETFIPDPQHVEDNMSYHEGYAHGEMMGRLSSYNYKR